MAGSEAQSRPEPSLPARYEALSRASRAICAYRDPAKLFRVLADELRQVVRFDSLAVLLYDEASHKVRTPVRETINGPELSIPDDFHGQLGFPKHKEVWLTGAMNTFNIWSIPDFESFTAQDKLRKEELKRKLGI